MRSDILFPQFETKLPISDRDMEHLGRCYTREEIRPWLKECMRKIRQHPVWKWANENFYNEDGTGWEMSPGQFELYKAILFREHKWVEVITGTQYGKTLTVARAVLTRITHYPGDILNIVPDQKRGTIMFKYIIEDSARNDFFASKLQGINVKENNLLNRLLTEHSKKKLTYQIIDGDELKGIGSIEILSADAKRKQNAITTIMGFGGRTIINDESALVDDEVDSAIFRMMAGKGEDTFLCKIGNPFFRNHFMADWKSYQYKKIYVDLQIALEEGRYTESFVEKALKKPNAGIFYRCEFPDQGAVDNEGWMMLMTDEQIKLAMQKAPHFGEERMGCDPADEGVNNSSIVKRSTGYAEILYAEPVSDPMDFTGQIVINSKEIEGKRIYVDRVGVGAGVYSRLNEVNRVDGKGMTITGVNAGEPAAEDGEYFNKRAEMYWRVRQWLTEGGKLSPDERWYQLTQIPYKPASRGRIQIMPKDQMRKRGIPSPDEADALSLTFYDAPLSPKMSDDEKFFIKKLHEKKMAARRKDRYGTRYTGH